MKKRDRINKEQFLARKQRKPKGPKFNHVFDPIAFEHEMTKLHDPNKVMSFSQI